MDPSVGFGAFVLLLLVVLASIVFTTLENMRAESLVRRTPGFLKRNPTSEAIVKRYDKLKKQDPSSDDIKRARNSALALIEAYESPNARGAQEILRRRWSRENDERKWQSAEYGAVELRANSFGLFSIPQICCRCGERSQDGKYDSNTVLGSSFSGTTTTTYKLKLPVCAKRRCAIDQVTGFKRPEAYCDRSPGPGSVHIANVHKRFVSACGAN